MMVQTLYENYLGLEGQMESDCKRNHDDILTRYEKIMNSPNCKLFLRMTHWDWSGPNGYDTTCQSKWKRHGICILGVEYLRELAKSQKVIGRTFGNIS